MAGGIIVLAIALSTGTIAFSVPTQDERLFAFTLQSMCEGSRQLIFDRMQANPSVFVTWATEMQALPANDQRYTHYFYDKPVDTPMASICQPMNTTCCNPAGEKHLVKVAQREYGELFLNVTEENIGTCFTVGRNFYHTMYTTFAEIRRQLEIPLNQILDDKLDVHLLDEFFSYLNSFPFASDICDLSHYVDSVMNDIFDFVSGGPSGTNYECYRNVSHQIMENLNEGLFMRLERQIYNLDLIYRALLISEEVLDSLKKHRFSSECTKPLTQLQNCAQCTGYFTFKPCLFYCMNVLRGCYADVADVYHEFKLLTRALGDIPDDVLGTFQPDVFIRDSLVYLVNLVEDLLERDLKTEVSNACTGNRGAGQRPRPVYRRQSSTNLATVTPTVTQAEDPLVASFNQELECMKDIGALLGHVPDIMCYQSRQHTTIADTGNHRCWTGSRMGTYWHSQVRFNKEAQAHNPEFQGRPPPYLNQYEELCMDISLITAEVNMTLDLALCLIDGDCETAPFYICESDIDEEPIVSSSGFGSGSGSGSGGGIDDGMRDMEDGDSTEIEDEEEDDDYIIPPYDPFITAEDTHTYIVPATTSTKTSVSTSVAEHSTTGRPVSTSPPPAPSVDIETPVIVELSSNRRLEAKASLLFLATMIVLLLVAS